MANWKTVTEDDIKLLDTEVTIMASVTPLQAIDVCVLNACNYVRGYLMGGGNQIEDAPTVPPECVDDVIALARATYLAQEPTGTLLTEVRREERDHAIDHLRDIAKGLSTITQGETLTADIFLFGKWGSQTQIGMRTNPT
jgi:hypothetical protein